MILNAIIKCLAKIIMKKSCGIQILAKQT